MSKPRWPLVFVMLLTVLGVTLFNNFGSDSQDRITGQQVVSCPHVECTVLGHTHQGNERNRLSAAKDSALNICADAFKTEIRACKQQIQAKSRLCVQAGCTLGALSQKGSGNCQLTYCQGLVHLPIDRPYSVGTSFSCEYSSYSIGGIFSCTYTSIDIRSPPSFQGGEPSDSQTNGVTCAAMHPAVSFSRPCTPPVRKLR